MLWDRLFGTYQAEEEKVIYGLIQNIKTSNPIKINFNEWIALFRDSAKTNNFKQKWLYFIKPPGWHI